MVSNSATNRTFKRYIAGAAKSIYGFELRYVLGMGLLLRHGHSVLPPYAVREHTHFHATPLSERVRCCASRIYAILDVCEKTIAFTLRGRVVMRTMEERQVLWSPNL